MKALGYFIAVVGIIGSLLRGEYSHTAILWFGFMIWVKVYGHDK